MCRGASNTPAICPGRLHRGRVRFGEPFRVRRPNSHADRVRLVAAREHKNRRSQSGWTNHQLAWPEKDGEMGGNAWSFSVVRRLPTFIVGCLYK
jgi:hypothetical protein